MKKQLMEMVSVPLHPAQLDGLRRIDTENFTKVRQKAKETLIAIGQNPSEHYLDAGIQGLKLYYALPLLDPCNAHAVSPEIDVFWHAHMLFSKQYTRFSKEVVGDMIHHAPLDRSDSQQLQNVRELYSYTIEVLHKLFDEEHIDDTVWPAHISDMRLVCVHYDCAAARPDLRDCALMPAGIASCWAFVL